MDIEARIRQLARSPYYQNLYRASKEMNGVHIFLNTSDFSGLQVLFLYWVKLYAIMYDELQTQEHAFLTEWVIKDDIRLDAFLHWRSVQHKKIINESNKNKKATHGKHHNPAYPIYRGSKKQEK